MRLSVIDEVCEAVLVLLLELDELAVLDAELVELWLPEFVADGVIVQVGVVVRLAVLLAEGVFVPLRVDVLDAVPD